MFDLHRSSSVSVPRLSLAGVMLAFVLSAVVATFVGVAAWSLASGSGMSQSDVAAARSTAYANGLSVGLAKGHTQAVTARKAGYSAGHKRGFQAGLKKGRKAGMRVGHHAGYTSGYNQGLIEGRVEGAASVTTSKKSKHHH